MAKRAPTTASKLSPAIRRNWGYWDGVAAQARGGRLPEWSKPSVYRTKHPFDASYGEGFWTGFYGETPPPNAVMAGRCRDKCDGKLCPTDHPCSCREWARERSPT